MAATPLTAPLSLTDAVPCATGTLPPLVSYLAQVPDPRDPRGVRHPLTAVLSLICAALLCGIDQLGPIAEWGRCTD